MEKTRFRKGLTALASLTTAGLILAGCASGTDDAGTSTPAEGDDGTTISSEPLKVYATAVPQAELLREVQDLADADGSGLQLDIIESDGKLDANELVAAGDVDATFIQHVPYFDSWVAAHPETTNLVNVATVLVNIFGLYSNEFDSAEDIPDGAQILVPNEQTNLPRALFILQDLGLIELTHPESDGSDAAVSIDESDIVSNPKNLELLPTETNLRAQSLPDVEASFVNGDIALSHDIDPNTAISLESPDNNPYANVITTTTDNADDPRIQKLVEYLTGEEIATIITDSYGGFILPVQAKL